MTIRMLYVCNEDRATTRQRLLALKEMGVSFDVVYTSRLDEKVSIVTRIGRAVRFRLGFFPERNNENAGIIKALQKKSYDILFVEKGLSVRRSTLVKAKTLHPGMKLVSYSLDDMMNPHNSSRQFRKALTIYDYHFTNKKYNIEELKKLGAKSAFYFRNAFSTHVHHPVEVSPDEIDFYKADVSFIGTYAKDRVELLRYLADNGISIKVWGWGPSAKKSGMIHPGIIMTGKYVYDEAYSKVVCSSKINLCLLRKVNRDRETTRSIEIPACGGFMIAEDTEEHRQLFRADTEVVYFSDKKELLEKIQFYLQNDEARKRIAYNGHKRCVEDDYSYQNQFRYIFSKMSVAGSININKKATAI
jgi:spore maturation protein CgeB